MVLAARLLAASADGIEGLGVFLVIIGLLSVPPILLLELRKRAHSRLSGEIPPNHVTAAVTNPSDLPTSFVVESGALFKVVGGTALICVVFGALVWSGAATIHDSAGVNGALVFLMVCTIVLLAAFVASRNIKLFVQHGMLGCVGPLGGVRACQLDDLTEIRTVWHWYQGRGMGMWVFPILHFRLRDGSDAFATPAILYLSDSPQTLGERLRLPIDLERPASRKAA
jgi:hypothetical protein